MRTTRDGQAAARLEETGADATLDTWSGSLSAPRATAEFRAAGLHAEADNALDQLSRALELGHSEALSDYLRVSARFHRYSVGNIMLIFSQRPEATMVAGFRRWNELGRYVRKGEHGIAILAPIIRKEAADTPEGEAEGGVRGFRAAYVFDVSQTEGKDLPQLQSVSGDPGERLDALKRHVAARGITLAYADLAPGTSGLSKGGGIELARDLTPAEEFSVLVHELAHELLHHDPEGERPRSKTVRETEAEAVAFVVSCATGLEPGNSSSDYIQLYDGDKQTLASSLERVRKTAATILDGIESEPHT